jgi:hypothetical protein
MVVIDERKSGFWVGFGRTGKKERDIVLNELDPQVKALLEQFRADAAQHPAPATPLSVQEKIVASRHLRCLV